MVRWIALIAVAFFGGNYIQRVVENHGVDVWIARGAGVATVAVIALIGYLLFLRPASEN